MVAERGWPRLRPVPRAAAVWIGALALRLLRDRSTSRGLAPLRRRRPVCPVAWPARSAAGARAGHRRGDPAPPSRLFDVLFIGEVFGTPWAPSFCCSPTVRWSTGAAGRLDPVRLAAAALAGGLTLLAKDSGAVFIAAAFPLAVVRSRCAAGGSGSTCRASPAPRFDGCRGAARLLVARLSIPARFAAVRAQDVRSSSPGCRGARCPRRREQPAVQLETLHVGVNICRSGAGGTGSGPSCAADSAARARSRDGCLQLWLVRCSR